MKLALLPKTCKPGSATRQLRFAARSVAPVARRTQFMCQASAALPTKYSKVSPVGNRVCVKVKKLEEKSTGGILLPTTGRNKPTAGEVISVGNETTSSGVKLGDNVVYSQYAGTELDIADTPHILLKEEDCIAVMSSGLASMQPLSDRVLIQCAQAEETTTGGLILTDNTKEKPLFGKVVAVGPGRKPDKDGKAEPMELAVGNTVMYSKYSGTDYDEDDTEYVVVRASDVLAVLD